jgi:predicted DNA-binding transcriptional regulator AlpA
MTAPMPRVHSNSPFMLRPELLQTVPHSMSTIDRLEAVGKFPKRVTLEPTNRVAWVRREVRSYVRSLLPAPSANHTRNEGFEG